MTNEKKEKNLEEELEKDDSSQEEKISEELSSKDEEIAELKKSLEEEKKSKEEYISHSQRLQADFENFKKQTEKRNKEIIAYANEKIIMDFLDSYEDLERALENSKNEKELREGVELIYSKLQNELKKEGLKKILAIGEKFDPFKHEALLAEKNDDYENGEIIEELMKGYTLKDKVIKYSKVKVCKK
ncbi:nucleotide exchange factor GrpE [Methanobrevibacter sp. DSM 116169]|uniref:nucleotide exchange factor GrpE n=1 Tax=Methanobrevibacter sp. DSM 116169 TaxID=3242727 RepID=UPI0038FC81E5